MNPGRYVKRFLKWAQAMRQENPEIKLTASGADELSDPKWNRVLVEGIGGRWITYPATSTFLLSSSQKHSE